ncbi:MAG: tetratricopeptide repeat protein [Desulfovibrionaceae bacterium]
MSEVSAPTPGKNSLADIPLLLRLPIQYWKQSVAVIVVILAVTGGYALVGVYQKSQSEKGEQALSKLVATTQGADRVTALEAMAKTAPSGVRDAVNLELAKAAQAMGDHAKAAAAWAAVAKTAPAAMRAIAGLGQAAALCQAGQADKAVTVLQTLKADCPKAFSMTVDRQLAITAEAAGQWKTALETYEGIKAAGAVQNPGFIDARIADLKAKAGAAAPAKTNG